MDKDLEIIKSKVLGSMLGGAIGDAMGYQIEFDRGIMTLTAIDNLRG